MDEITHTIMPGNTGGWGGTALGAGVGGLIGSWLGNGGRQYAAAPDKNGGYSQ